MSILLILMELLALTVLTLQQNYIIHKSGIVIRHIIVTNNKTHNNLTIVFIINNKTISITISFMFIA
jgi:hypothetical protein